MHISRRAAAVGAGVIIGLAALGAAGAAFTSHAAPAAHTSVQVLRLHTTDLSSVVNHAGHGGPGDVFTVVYGLRTPAGAEAGKAYLSCTAVTASVNLCHAAYVLKGGQIDVQVAVPGTTAPVTSRSPAAPAPTRGSPAGPAPSTPGRTRATGRST
jgi:hypothetical protein